MTETNNKLPKTEVDPNTCKGCGICIQACPKDVLEPSGELNSSGYIYTKYKGDGCIGCAMCFYSCPEPGAITVYKK